MRRTIVGLVTAMALAAPASAQMVVIDHAALAKHIETARNTLNQLQKAQQQLQEAQRLYGSFNKITDIKSVASILDNDLVQRGLPADLGSSAKLLSTDLASMGELGARAQDLMRSRDLNGAIAMSDAAIKMASRGAARDQAIAEATLGVAAARSEGLSRMADRLGTATTAKEVMDLQARAAIEAAAAVNQTNQLMALELGRQADARARSAAGLAAARQADAERSAKDRGHR
jgi:type IV secretion system protein VirB5